MKVEYTACTLLLRNLQNQIWFKGYFMAVKLWMRPSRKESFVVHCDAPSSSNPHSLSAM